MKLIQTPRARTFLLSLLVPVLFSGCHNFPRDSYIQGAKSTVNTPWGPSTLQAEIVATGTAAKNITVHVESDGKKSPSK